MEVFCEKNNRFVILDTERGTVSLYNEEGEEIGTMTLFNKEWEVRTN